MELSAEQQALLDEWAAEARTDDLAGRAGGAAATPQPLSESGDVLEPEFDPDAAPCAVCGLRPGEGRMAWERSLAEGRSPDGSGRWYVRHQRAMRRGDEGAEWCAASRAADLIYNRARRERRAREALGEVG